VTPNHYCRNYDTKERFCSYWHQIQEVVLLNPRSILDIGIGNGFVSRYLREKGYNVITSDIDKRLAPDTVASVVNVPFSDQAFEVVTCYEVLEHLPFGCFRKALSELFRVSCSHVLLSIPDVTRAYRMSIELPRFGWFKKLVQTPTLNRIVHHFDGEHFWEIGKAGYSLSTIVKAIIESGLKIAKTYRVFEMPYHRLFVLKREKG
jgi:ubiquinone/menaquinone biosynthesis C-methylase UbiE